MAEWQWHALAWLGLHVWALLIGLLGVVGEGPRDLPLLSGAALMQALSSFMCQRILRHYGRWP